MAGPDIKLKCPECKFNLTLGPANTVLVWVKQHEFMSYLETECSRPACGHNWLTFLDADDPVHTRKLLKSIQKARWQVKILTPTTQFVIGQYEEAAEVKLLQPIELTARLEAHVKVLAWELEGATVQDILDADIESHLPKRWI